jgi:hypothetical protein
MIADARIKDEWNPPLATNRNLIEEVVAQNIPSQLENVMA